MAMIIKGIRFYVFCKLFTDLLDHVTGISFDDEGLVTVLLTNTCRWKVVRNLIGGVNIYYAEEPEGAEKKLVSWHWVGELDADEYLSISIC